MAIQNMELSKIQQIPKQASARHFFQPRQPSTLRPFMVSMTPAARKAIIASAQKEEEEGGKGLLGTALDVFFLPNKLGKQVLEGAGNAGGVRPDQISAVLVGVQFLIFAAAIAYVA